MSKEVVTKLKKLILLANKNIEDNINTKYWVGYKVAASKARILIENSLLNIGDNNE